MEAVVEVCPACGDHNCVHLTKDEEIACCVCGYNHEKYAPELYEKIRARTRFDRAIEGKPDDQ